MDFSLSVLSSYTGVQMKARHWSAKMRKSYQWVAVLAVFLAAHGWALPSPSMTEAKALAAKEIERALYWSPLRMPYEVGQSSQDLEARFLQVLYKHGLIARDSYEEKVAREINGVTRMQIELRWRYDYKTPPRSFDEEGIYYGDGQVLSVKIYPSVETSRRLMAQLDVKWGVKNIQPWVQDPVFKQARTLRRSLESKNQPFEKTLYVQYQNGAWVLWQPE